MEEEEQEAGVTVSEELLDQRVSHSVSTEQYSGNSVTQCIKGADVAMLVNQKLPYELLLVLFSYLFIPEDLVSVQRVCCGWRVAAQDISLWKNFTLTISGILEDERKVRTMPALRNVDGYANNEFIDIILENVRELVQMNITFMPPLSSLQTHSIIQKYPKLESLTLDMSAPDIIESVNILKRSKTLKVLNFTVPDFVTGVDNDDDSDENMLPLNFLKIYTILADDKNFPALTNIDLSDGYFCFIRVIYAGFLNVMTDVIRNRCQQLSSLKVIVSNTDSENFVNAINLCTRLHTLHIELLEDQPSKHPISLNVASMTQLTSLYLHMRHSVSFLPSLCDSLYKGSWEHLRELDLSMSNENHLDILRSVIQNVKQIRKLIYRDRCGNTNEMELQKISNLHQLETLHLNGLASISEDGMNFLSQCTNLISLMLCACSTNISNFDQCIVKVIKPMRKLENLRIVIQQKYLVLRGRQMIDVFISETLHQAQ